MSRDRPQPSSVPTVEDDGFHRFDPPLRSGRSSPFRRRRGDRRAVTRRTGGSHLPSPATPVVNLSSCRATRRGDDRSARRRRDAERGTRPVIYRPGNGSELYFGCCSWTLWADSRISTDRSRSRRKLPVIGCYVRRSLAQVAIMDWDGPSPDGNPTAVWTCRFGFGVNHPFPPGNRYDGTLVNIRRFSVATIAPCRSILGGRGGRTRSVSLRQRSDGTV